MKVFSVFTCLVLLLSVVMINPSHAQRAFGEVTDQPLCFNIISEADNTVYGKVRTNYFERADGATTRHTSNFKLAPGEQREVCTSGPFYEGRKVEFLIVTFFPVFSCNTRATGDVIIKDERNEDGVLRTWAECNE